MSPNSENRRRNFKRQKWNKWPNFFPQNNALHPVFYFSQMRIHPTNSNLTFHWLLIHLRWPHYKHEAENKTTANRLWGWGGTGQLDTSRELRNRVTFTVIVQKTEDSVEDGLKWIIFLYLNLKLFYAEMINTKHTNAKDCLQKNTKDFKLRKYQNLE